MRQLEDQKNMPAICQFGREFILWLITICLCYLQKSLEIRHFLILRYSQIIDSNLILVTDGKEEVKVLES